MKNFLQWFAILSAFVAVVGTTLGIAVQDAKLIDATKQAERAAPQAQASPTAQAMATPTMIQPTQAPEIRPTLEMGIMPTRYAEQTVDVAALEKQIKLQAEQKRLELDIQREKDNLDKARAEWEDARNQKYLVWGLVSLGVIFGLIVAVNVYARSIVANFKKAGELVKSRQNAPQAPERAGNEPNAQPFSVNKGAYLCPVSWASVVAWSEYVEKTTKGAITRENEYYQFFIDANSKTGFGNWRKFYSWLQSPSNDFIEISNGQKQLNVNYYDWLEYWLDNPPTE